MVLWSAVDLMHLLPGGKAYASSSVISTVAGRGASTTGEDVSATSVKLNYPHGVAIDGSGNVYIAETSNQRLRKVDASGNISTVAGTGVAGYSGDGGAGKDALLNMPSGVAMDGSGNLFIAEYRNHIIRKVDPTGKITTVAGTGTSGTVVDGGAATSSKLDLPYGIAVDSSGNLYIADGGSSVIRKVNTSGIISTIAGKGATTGSTGDGGLAKDALLKNPYGIAVDGGGNLYIADTNNHRIRKVDTAGYISTVAGTGTAGKLGDGGAATSAQLNGPAGVAVDSFGNLYIADSKNHRVRKVSASGIISTVAGSGLGSYSGDGGAAIVARLQGPTGVAVDSASGTLYIADYSNHAIRKVTNLYSNTDLSGLTISSGTLSPAFVPGTASYTASVANSVDNVTLTPTVSDPGATVKVDGTAVMSGTPSNAISLNVGSNAIAVEVTAQDGTTQTYPVTVTRQSNNADLSALALSSGTLSPAFTSGTTGYTASVTNSVYSVTVTPVVSDLNATVKVNGTAVISGIASQAVNLNIGSNAIEVEVTAQDGTKQTYSVIITRLESSDAELSGLTLSNGTLSPSFTKSTTNYTASVTNSVYSVTVTPAVNDSNATVTVDGLAVASGSGSQPINLNVGSNTISVEVSAQDGTTQMYTVTVTRAGSNNAELSGLALSSGTLSPSFTPNTTNYTASVINSVSSVTVTPTVDDSNATVKVGGMSAISGSASNAIALNEGDNTIVVEVTSQDGTKKTYTVTATRESAPSSGGTVPPGDGLSGNEEWFPVLVDGKAYDWVAKGISKEYQGNTVLTLTVNIDALKNQLAQEEKPVIVILAEGADADQVNVAFTGETVKALANMQALLVVRTPNGSYSMPATEIAVDKITPQLGAFTKLSDVIVQMSIRKSGQAMIGLANQAAEKGQFSLVGEPIDFTITVTSNGKSLEVDKFGIYVEREIPLPDGVDANAITTAVKLDADGTSHHVPSRVIIRDGKAYVVIHSLTNSTYALIKHVQSFVDMAGHWAEEAVNDMASRIVVNGVGDSRYNPDGAVTRAEFVAILIRALGLSDNGKMASLNDVQANDWFVGAVAKAQEYGLVNGYKDGTFGPNKTITRQEALVMLARAMKLTGLNAGVSEANATDVLASYEDGANIAPWAVQALAETVKTGIVQGSGRKLLPDRNMTRAETAVIVQRLLDKAGLIDSK
ncbi:cadherin-like beta sandwich domain-containing protein [Paenibacillus sp. MMS18-CY102]|uniref:cadherin-like beta sandwich domain-containing protein n=1 Tax=Paenibacillus sp. MMS18-CY102 TaxID=2682849 RepID=UPI0013653F6B|nr:cadherin-like beta sandwich domain-containing protein [Paenibacillus sp. MMS18-CY102]